MEGNEWGWLRGGIKKRQNKQREAITIAMLNTGGSEGTWKTLKATLGEENEEGQPGMDAICLIDHRLSEEEYTAIRAYCKRKKYRTYLQEGRTVEWQGGADRRVGGVL